jgi:hypothetical protein
MNDNSPTTGRNLTFQYSNQYGTINWSLNNFTTYGQLTFPGNITISQDFVSVTESLLTLNPTFNTTTLITLNNLPTNYTKPQIFHNGNTICDDTTTPPCHNFTSLNAGTVIFNVSSWSNYSIGESAPIVTLSTPPQNYYNDSSSPVNVTFQCNATDYLALQNISLYITNQSNSSFALNQTANIGGISNSTSWTLPLTNGNYTWNCQAYDTSGNSAFDGNRSIQINYVPPTAILYFNYTMKDFTNSLPSSICYYLFGGQFCVSGNNGTRAGHTTCWKADAKTIGYCTTQPDANGQCTCN